MLNMTSIVVLRHAGGKTQKCAWGILVNAKNECHHGRLIRAEKLEKIAGK